MTDDAAAYYNKLGEFADHDAINHSAKEYVRYASGKHRDSSHTVEGYFSIFKHGMKAVYQHCSETHLHRYLVEFDFRYNARVALGVNDAERGREGSPGRPGSAPKVQVA